MSTNVGGLDRILRIIVGLALIAYAFYGAQPIAYIGVVPLITGLIGICPIYSIFKISTCKKR